LYEFIVAAGNPGDANLHQQIAKQSGPTVLIQDPVPGLEVYHAPKC